MHMHLIRICHWNTAVQTHLKSLGYYFVTVIIAECRIIFEFETWSYFVSSVLCATVRKAYFKIFKKLKKHKKTLQNLGSTSSTMNPLLKAYAGICIACSDQQQLMFQSII